ncbi:hypothetical protein BAUCODRAFT_149136 [Baudoinia panamericana UAMH 10762]|uniref:C3H1-type domain-containing protein n=1 Tax=Baudoinia panamericana (strain UAMH 10762) TaxID=717646 RepID=M2MEU5_BAUPA|nr:uncharacterized protein BAUCODRAFT_149136 [Baudoinia panamericana UAMH 10762]EMC95111.1 hypothetical protein BAUCODRAFT_149136 [Baudoinia panamericana UAMH 10762]
MADDDPAPGTTETRSKPSQETCFIWYHGKCKRSLNPKTAPCPYLHALTDVPSMVQPPPGYVHPEPCGLPWCPGDGVPKPSPAKPGGGDFKGFTNALGRSREKYEGETGDSEAETKDNETTSEAPSCGEPRDEGRPDWYLSGFDEE